MPNLVVAMTGASGSAYAIRLLEVLIASGYSVHLTISPAAVEVAKQELNLKIELNAFDPQQLLPSEDQIAHDSKLGQLKAGGSAGHAASSIFSDSEVFTAGWHDQREPFRVWHALSLRRAWEPQVDSYVRAIPRPSLRHRPCHMIISQK